MQSIILVHTYIRYFIQHIIVQSKSLFTLGRELARDLRLQIIQLSHNILQAQLLFDDVDYFIVVEAHHTEVVYEGITLVQLLVELLLLLQLVHDKVGN